MANSQYYTLTLYSVERCTRLCVHGREKNEDTGNDVGDMAVDIQLRPYTGIWGQQELQYGGNPYEVVWLL